MSNDCVEKKYFLYSAECAIFRVHSAEYKFYYEYKINR